MSAPHAPEIDCDFPGGNVILDGIDGDMVHLRQDPRDTEGFWFWWYMRVRGAAGRALRFRFTDGQVIGVRGPAASSDGGRTWRWLWDLREGRSDAFEHRFGEGEDDVRFAFAIPRLESDLARWLAPREGDPSLRVEEHCRSRKGRSVERLVISDPARDGEPGHRLLFTSRHHACESMGTCVMLGVLEEALSDSEAGRWLRSECEIAAVPFVDKDGVEDGDQGKNRRPHDHNRDYAGDSVHPEVAAMREWAPAWSGGRLRVAMDLHCPSICGEWSEHVYVVGSRDERFWQSACGLSDILESDIRGPIPYAASGNLPFGTAWNKAENYGENLRSFSRWAQEELGGLELSCSFEFPYANVSGIEVSTAAARGFGRDLARALARYLREI